MAVRTPLILISGAFSQLPVADTVPGTDTIAQASGNAALVVASNALSSGTAALASGNAALSSAATATSNANTALSRSATYQTLSVTTASINDGANADYTINAGNVFTLLQVTSSKPAWTRVYRTNADRAADARTTPGAPYPSTGSGFYAEVLTNATPQAILMSPVAVCQGVSGVAYVRTQNRSGSPSTITTDFYVLTLASGT